MSQKLKGVRAIDDINAEYSQACGRLGDFTYRRSYLAKEIEKLQTRIGELDLEAASCKQQMDAQEAAKPTPTDTEAPGEAIT